MYERTHGGVNVQQAARRRNVSGLERIKAFNDEPPFAERMALLTTYVIYRTSCMSLNPVFVGPPYGGYFFAEISSKL